MSKRYTVACGVLSHAIYASEVLHNGKPDDHCTNVTTEAINAVRDYMVDSIKEGNSTGYSWKRADGKIVKLVCVVEDTL